MSLQATTQPLADKNSIASKALASTAVAKEKFYSEIYIQLEALLRGEPNRVTRMATIAAALAEERKFHWVGFYLVDGDELVLGPFAGPLACFRIKKGRGVCGTAWAQNKSQWVPNVHEFEGHIACSGLSNSEIVIPLRDAKTKEVWGVFDIDHVDIGGLERCDLEGLEKIASLVSS